MIQKRGDHLFLLFLVALILFGFAILASASTVLSYGDYGNSYGYLQHQIIYGFIPGMFLFFLGSRIKLSFFKKYSLLFLILTIALLFMLFVPGIGFEAKGAARWISISFLTFQPSELLKLSFIIYLAAWLETRKNSISSFSEGLVPFLVICSLVAILLISQPDVGTLGVILLIGAFIYFAAGAKVSHMLLSALAGIIALSVLVYSEQYRFRRWTAFLNPDLDPLGAGYQVKQALIAIGSGGLFGLGFGMSKQKYNYLPEAMGDSIFAITAEELGFIGAAVLVFLFIGLAWRGFKIAKKAPSTFASLTAVGISSWISLQAFVNMGAISGLMPLTGIPLPFVSYGGSSMLVLLAACGILYNISKK